MAVSDRLCLIGIFLQLTITLQSFQVSSMKIQRKDPTQEGGLIQFAEGGTVTNGALTSGSVKITTVDKDGQKTTTEYSVYEKCKDDKEAYCDVKGNKVIDILETGQAPCTITLTTIGDKILKSESAGTSSEPADENETIYDETHDETPEKKYIKVGVEDVHPELAAVIRESVGGLIDYNPEHKKAFENFAALTNEERAERLKKSYKVRINKKKE